jgi:DNA-binding PadR family transcriptional regulator
MAQNEKRKTPQTTLKRPNALVIKGILEFLNEKGLEGYQNYSDLIEFSTNTTKNRRDLALYLKLLVDLKWIRRSRSVGAELMPGDYYELTEKGKKFLELFPKRRTET